ncbi:hypothetical protein CNR22_17240 [Sphingobacteriaceae bacterium]|nr:hypothetical protein CNR22_17240 [Sphingobacteriaceae bacterium]
MLVLVVVNLQAHAGIPGAATLEHKKAVSFDIKLGRLSLIRQKSLEQQSSSLIFRSGNLDAGFISGLQKKTKNSYLDGILKWDFKVKFKLNKNMNIIFSYN